MPTWRGRSAVKCQLTSYAQHSRQAHDIQGVWQCGRTMSLGRAGSLVRRDRQRCTRQQLHQSEALSILSNECGVEVAKPEGVCREGLRESRGVSTISHASTSATLLQSLVYPNMPLADYLASKYLSADPKPSKKRKRKEAKLEGLSIAEDDVDDWTRPKGNDEEDEDAPTMVGGGLSAGLNKRTKKTKWVKVGAAAPTNSEQAAADAILADAQKDSEQRQAQDEDAPAVVGEDGGDYDGPTMANGAMAGLQTAEQVSAALKRREKQERKRMEEAGLDPTGKAQETIYRDASGRIINVAMKRAEMRAKAEEEERKQREELEARKGDVQRREKEQRRQDLEEAKVMGIARYADDEKLNAELKEQERWNDPMAQLLATKKSSKSGGKSKGSGKTYQGAFEPNRYGIKPGWRWDGVDRGNGFERKWFAARNKKRDREELEYHWQMDE